MLDAGIGTVVHENQNYFLEQAGEQAEGGRCAGEEKGEGSEEREQREDWMVSCEALWRNGLGGFFGERGCGWFLAVAAET